MRNAVLSCALIALAVLGAEARLAHNRDILNAYSSSSAHGEGKGKDSKSKIKATATSHGGIAAAKGEAYTEVDANAVNAVAVALTEAYALVKSGEPATAAAQAQATAVGEAFALAYASAYAHVFSSGEHNQACVHVFASGEAAATAFAKAYVEGVAIAKNKHGELVAEGAAEAFKAATAKAYAEAEAKVCIIGKGEARALQESLAYSLVRVVATAMVKVLAHVDSAGVTSGFVDVVADSKAEPAVTFAAAQGQTDVDIRKGTGFADATGFGVAGAKEEKPCTGYFKHKCCRGYSYYSGQCNCGYGGYCAATAEPHKLGYDTVKLWTVKKAAPYSRYGNGYSCYCH